MKKNLILLLAGFVLFASCGDKNKTKNVTSITITPDNASLATGVTQQFSEAVLPTDAVNQKVTWKTSDNTKATVNSSGLVTAIANGSVTLTATATDGSDVKGTATITIRPIVARITVTSSSNNATLSVGGNLTLSASVSPAEAAQGVTWSSVDATKATVDAAGKVTGVATGNTIIRAAATDGSNVKGEITVYVQSNSAGDAGLTAITLGSEKFNVTVPEAGSKTTVSNAPRTVASTITAVPVNLIKGNSEAVVKVNSLTFTNGGVLNFSSPVIFTVISANGNTTKTYTVEITAYNAGTNPYGIYTGKHLLNIQDGGYSASYLLINDITLPPLTKEGATEIGDSDYEKYGFSSVNLATGGKFDGGGHVIKNLICKSDLGGGSIGLFESIGGTVQNLGVETGSAGVSSSQASASAGILAGRVYSGGTIKNCYTKGKVSGGGTLGGVVGYMEYPCQIENTYSTADVTFSDGASGGYGGSFLGRSKLGDAGKAIVTNCFATGSVTGDGTKNKLGGFMGENNGSTFTSCYFPKSQPAGGAGLSLPRPADSPATGFKPVAQSSFEGWDFTNKWKWVDGKWPQLRAFVNQPGVDLPK